VEGEEPKGWKTDIVEYLLRGILLVDKEKARKLRTQPVRYVVVAGDLYQRGFSSPLLKCLNGE